MNLPLPTAASDRQIVDCTKALCELSTFDAIIDVRSPSEFSEDHLPGAINAPVLDDAERALIGMLHKLEGAFTAKRRGAVLVARNIAMHLERSFADMPRTWRPLIYCWRGGQRSAAMTHVMARVGWHAQQLDGGYRAYRRQVISDLASLPQRFHWRVIAGTTGSGKSRLLNQILALKGQALDLEALACHRGSVLGSLPASPQPSQKMFESLLWQALQLLDPSRPVFVESESRKIGALHLPDDLLSAIRAADCIRLELPLEERVKLLREDYAHLEATPQVLISQLECLTPLHGHARIGEWATLAQAADWTTLVRRLLVEHYDPAYQRSIRSNFSRASTARPLLADTGDNTALRRLAEALVSG